MIVRIVKMTFRKDKTDEFLAVFNSSSHLIRAMHGCNKLQLLRDVSDPSVFFTYSYWQTQQDLDDYRASETFRKVWASTKILFEARAEAWSTEQLVEIYLAKHLLPGYICLTT